MDPTKQNSGNNYLCVACYPQQKTYAKLCQFTRASIIVEGTFNIGNKLIGKGIISPVMLEIS